VQNPGGIGKGQQTNSGFSAGRTTHRFVGSALGVKLQGLSAALEDRAGCLDITAVLSPSMSCTRASPSPIATTGTAHSSRS
jgi:hypothetical protein